MANQYKNKVIYNGTTLIDISDTTAVQSDVASGKSFYTASGQRVLGTGSTGGSGGTGQTATGTVTGDGTSVLEIPCDFEPDLVYVYGDMSGDVANRGIISLTIIKDASIYIGADTSTSSIQENVTSIHGITGYNESDASNIHATYLNGTLTIDTMSSTSAGKWRSGQVYNYELSTIGTGGGGSGYTRTVVAEEQTVTPVSTSSGGSTYYSATLNVSEGFEANAEYIITFNDTEYFFTCQVLWGTNYLLGDINYFYGVSDLPYPFGIAWTSGTTCTLARNNGNQVTIKIEKLELTGNGGSGGGLTNPLSGKILSATGDSIAAGAGNNGSGYPEIVASDNNMTLQNVAVGGGTVAYINASTFCISRSISSMRSDADFVLLEGGGNDADSGVPLGTLSSGYTATLDDTTFAGAIESMFKSALARFPNKKIGYVFIHKCASLFDSRVSNSYYDMAKSACEKWGIPYLDLNTQVPPLNYIADLKNTYTANGDGYHPNELGYRTFYVPKVTAFLNTMLTDKTLINKTVTANGTYLATNDDVDGYNSVTVNVSGGTSGGSGLITENIVPEQSINCTVSIGNIYGGYINQFSERTQNESYYLVTLNGTEYIARAFYASANYLVLGDTRIYEGSSNTYIMFPFLIVNEANAFYLAVQTSGTYTLKVDKIISYSSTLLPTSHTILFEFEDTTSASITAYWDDTFISNAIKTTVPTTYDSKTVQEASIDEYVWYIKPSENWSVLYDGSITFVEGSPNNSIWLGALGDLQPTVGEVYRVTIDGTVYNLTAHEDDGQVYIGNPAYDWGTDDESGVPFCLFNGGYGSLQGWTELSATEHTVKIERSTAS